MSVISFAVCVDAVLADLAYKRTLLRKESRNRRRQCARYGTFHDSVADSPWLEMQAPYDDTGIVYQEP